MTATLAAVAEAVPAGALLLLKSAFILLAASAASRSMRHNARLRSLLWRCTYGMLFLLPVLQIVLPERLLNWFDLQHAGLLTTVPIGPGSVPLVLLLVFLWSVGVVAALVRFGRDWSAARKLVARSLPLANARITSLHVTLAGETGGARVSLRTSDEVHAPALFGFRRPVILLPSSAGAWTDDEVRAALLHELEHARRLDWPVMIAERLVGILYWPNVLLRHAERVSGEVREQLADRAVLHGSIAPASYANQLLHLARVTQQSSAGALTLALVRDPVEFRVKALFVDEGTSSGIAHSSALMVATALAFLPVLAALRPWTCVPALAALTSLC